MQSFKVSFLGQKSAPYLLREKTGTTKERKLWLQTVVMMRQLKVKMRKKSKEMETLQKEKWRMMMTMRNMQTKERRRQRLILNVKPFSWKIFMEHLVWPTRNLKRANKRLEKLIKRPLCISILINLETKSLKKTKRFGSKSSRRMRRLVIQQSVRNTIQACHLTTLFQIKMILTKQIFMRNLARVSRTIHGFRK